MRRLILLPALITAFTLAACGGASTPAPAASQPAASQPAAASPAAGSPATSQAAASAGGGGAACAVAPAGSTGTVMVTIKDFKFAPQPVQAKVGDVVTWTNQDSVPHSATLDNGACDTDSINNGANASLVFNAPGTYTYHCKIHPTQMKDYSIVVS
jgi:plastocyanin